MMKILPAKSAEVSEGLAVHPPLHSHTQNNKVQLPTVPATREKQAVFRIRIRMLGSPGIRGRVWSSSNKKDKKDKKEFFYIDPDPLLNNCFSPYQDDLYSTTYSTAL